MTIPVFYTENMVADSASFSPSARKPQHVVSRWQARGLPITVREPAPLSIDELSVTHSRDYVEGVLQGQIDNGFENRDLKVAATLPYTNGAMYAAALAAMQRPLHVACAPVSGFHHAEYDRGKGFCTFNGLVVTAMLLLKRKLSERVGILDIDAHYGDGTDQLIAHHGIGRIEHWTFGRYATSRSQALQTLPTFIPTLERFKRMGCDVVLYQAGADPHIQDPYGGFLTDEELRQRDQDVFRTAAQLDLPIAWNLAGGYQQRTENRHDAESISPVLDIHEATMRECALAYGLLR